MRELYLGVGRVNFHFSLFFHSRPFYEKRMSAEVAADFLGDEWKVSSYEAVTHHLSEEYLLCDVCLQGYVVRITGGNDKQGFPMKQGVLTAGRVKLLLSKGHSCYRPRRKGQRRRRSVHGCIVDGSLSVLNLVIVKKGVQVGVSTCVTYDNCLLKGWGKLLE